MIQTKFGHIQFNVHPQNLPFYKDLFAFIDWPTLEEDPTMLGVGHNVFNSLWFFGEAKEVHNDYDGPGMNHLGLLVQKQGEVDQMVAWLRAQNISCLFETPRHRPEFSLDAEHTYYQVMFASPDGILFEVVYMGPLEK
jgi:catechol 2,3-dioxygenase-like lactoylglutathione lyase family enzyme